MNKEIQSRFLFPVEPVFLSYEQSVKHTELPFVEGVVDYYDSLVRYRTFHYLHDAYSIHQSALLQESISMKPDITIQEVMDVLDAYSLFYVDKYDTIHHMPKAEVW